MVDKHDGETENENTQSDPKHVSLALGDVPISPTPNPVISEDKTGAASASENREHQPQGTPPISRTPSHRTHLVELIEKPDKEPSQIDKRTLRIAYWGLFLAAITGALFLAQLRIMGDQTQLLGAQFVTGVANAISSDALTNKQITALQTQAAAAQASADAIQTQMRQDQRAWMKVVPKGTPSVTVNQPITLGISVTNVGKTPALHVITEAVVEQLENGVIPTFEYVGVPRIADTTGDMWPGDEVTLNAIDSRRDEPPKDHVAPKPLLLTEFQAFHAGKRYFVVYVRVRYVDIFGLPHQTHWCHWGNAADTYTTFSSGACTNYNSVDTN